MLKKKRIMENFQKGKSMRLENFFKIVVIKKIKIILYNEKVKGKVNKYNEDNKN